MKKARQKISVRDKDLGLVEVDAIVLGEEMRVAVHRSIPGENGSNPSKRWTVTHVPSGAKLHEMPLPQPEALAIAVTVARAHVPHESDHEQVRYVGLSMGWDKFIRAASSVAMFGGDADNDAIIAAFIEAHPPTCSVCSGTGWDPYNIDGTSLDPSCPACKDGKVTS